MNASLFPSSDDETRSRSWAAKILSCLAVGLTALMLSACEIDVDRDDGPADIDIESEPLDDDVDFAPDVDVDRDVVPDVDIDNETEIEPDVDPIEPDANPVAPDRNFND